MYLGCFFFPVSFRDRLGLVPWAGYNLEHLEDFVLVSFFGYMGNCWLGARWFGLFWDPPMKGIVT